jgi:hypothetical protein
MSGAYGAGGIAAGDVIGECRAEARQTTFQLVDERRKHVIASGGAFNAPDLIDEPAIEQQGFHCSYGKWIRILSFSALCTTAEMARRCR